MTADVGWAFAIGAGRHLDYRVIAAPDFLVRSGEYGVLGDIARPSGPGQPNQLRYATTPAGQQLTIACVSQAITTNDIADPSQPTTANDAVRDEQNRPLRLIFGIAIDRRLVGTVDQSDIEAARAAAIRAYQSFLTHEDDFTVLSSTAFPLRSGLTPDDHRTPYTDRRPVSDVRASIRPPPPDSAGAARPRVGPSHRCHARADRFRHCRGAGRICVQGHQ